VSNTLYIIDGSAYIYRAYHAVAPLTNSSGQYTHAVYGFINIIRRLIKDKNPSRLFVAWDSRGKVFRHDMYSEYKANRPPMPDDLASQLPYIKKYVEAAAIASVEIPGVEADDIIATAALNFEKEGHKVVIVSGDKDLLQLVSDSITAWDPMKNKTIDIEGVKEKYNVGPDQLLDCFALMGDSSDNVPGVPGVGPKTAQKLINEHKTLDQLYADIDTLKKSKMKEKLIAHRDDAFMSRDLIRLKTDVELPADMDFSIGEADTTELYQLYEELEFKTLLKEVEVLDRVDTQAFELVTTLSQLEALEKALEGAVRIVVDTETSSLEARHAQLVGISLCLDTEKAWYIPVGHLHEDGSAVDGQLDKERVLATLRPILTSSEVAKIGHNLKYDYTVFKQDCNIIMGGLLIDTMLAAYLLDPARRGLKLDDLCRGSASHQMKACLSPWE
jgi:DNA polymerase-1